MKCLHCLSFTFFLIYFNERVWLNLHKLNACMMLLQCILYPTTLCIAMVFVNLYVSLLFFF
jgi:hypothetical protein